MNKSGIAGLLILCSSISGFTQEMEEKKIELANLDQFIDHFNYTDSAIIKRVESVMNRPVERVEFLNALCSDVNVEKKEFVDHFVNEVVKKNQVIDFYEVQLSASLIGFFEYKKEEIKIPIAMTNMVYPSHSEWQISKIDLRFLTMRFKEDTALFLSPNSHINGFIGLNSIFRNVEGFSNYYNQSFSYDELSVFLHLLRSKELTFIGSSGMTYSLNLAGYSIELTFDKSENLLSGWLITGIKKSKNR
ncbi:MAG: hypothetical protein ABJP45_18635 [Cyclobacteriaceae bacterium]